LGGPKKFVAGKNFLLVPVFFGIVDERCVEILYLENLVIEVLFCMDAFELPKPLIVGFTVRGYLARVWLKLLLTDNFFGTE
jgi:hypothetical protein